MGELSSERQDPVHRAARWASAGHCVASLLDMELELSYRAGLATQYPSSREALERSWSAGSGIRLHPGGPAARRARSFAWMDCGQGSHFSRSAEVARRGAADCAAQAISGWTRRFSPRCCSTIRPPSWMMSGFAGLIEHVRRSRTADRDHAARGICRLRDAGSPLSIEIAGWSAPRSGGSSFKRSSTWNICGCASAASVAAMLPIRRAFGSVEPVNRIAVQPSL